MRWNICGAGWLSRGSCKETVPDHSSGRIDVPVPVELSDLPSEISKNKLNLKWSKPGDNGTPLIHFIVCQKLLNKHDSVHDWILVKWTNKRVELT
ncbi:hypothetical protein ACROYT_G043298 [Oculina patagonica]